MLRRGFSIAPRALDTAKGARLNRVNRVQFHICIIGVSLISGVVVNEGSRLRCLEVEAPSLLDQQLTSSSLLSSGGGGARS